MFRYNYIRVLFNFVQRIVVIITINYETTSTKNKTKEKQTFSITERITHTHAKYYNNVHAKKQLAVMSENNNLYMVCKFEIIQAINIIYICLRLVISIIPNLKIKLQLT